MQYSKEHVEYSELRDLHVRGSSAKQTINLNKRIVVFILHRNGVYSWSEDLGKQPPNLIQDQVTSRHFDRADNEVIYFAAEKLLQGTQIKIFQFFKVRIEFSNYETELIFEEKQDLDLIKTFGFDKSQ